MTPNHYIIDTSSLIALNRFNPHDLYPSVWEKLLTLNSKDHLHAPLEVLYEIVRQDDIVAQWAKDHKELCVKETKKQLGFVTSILQDYPSLVDTSSDHNADPWLIALA